MRSLARPADPAELARQHGMTEPELELRTVAALRSLTGLGGPRACDIRVGAYLLSPRSRAERDMLMRRLHDEIDPGELDLLETGFHLVRRATRYRSRLISKLTLPTGRLPVPVPAPIEDPPNIATLGG